MIVQGSDSSDGFYEEPSLICGDDLMVYSLQTMAPFNASVRLSVQGMCVVRCHVPIVWFFYCKSKLGSVTLTSMWIEGSWCSYTVLMDSPTLEECSRIPIGSRLACGSPSVSQEACLQNDCCYGQTNFGTPCYYGNKVTAKCTKDGLLTVAISKDVTTPSLILTSVKLLRGCGPECRPVAQNDDFLLFSFPLSSCGTVFTVSQSFSLIGGAWRLLVLHIGLHIRCSFVANGLVPVNVEVFTLPPPSPASSAGPLTLEMRIGKDLLYQQYYAAEEYPILKFLRDPIYFEVHILNRNDPNLVLMLSQCWATTTNNPFQIPQWPILVDGCPSLGDQYDIQTVKVESADPYATHYKRFMVNTFTFVDSVSQKALEGLVYFHCSAFVCVPSAQDACVTGCRNRQRRALNNKELETLVSAEGPVKFYMKEKESLIEGMPPNGYLSKMGWSLAVVPGSLFGILLLVVILLKKHKKNTNKNIVL
ncbi:zona pellucida sperm-binding protein 4-like [Pyxicephalus adspersus]|uniref:zona pellucida sperm-binding protein 4-like n=1 Tax=Pyxicephalus adspersus TaxID=30357 RepID=UPI003B5BE6B1